MAAKHRISGGSSARIRMAQGSAVQELYVLAERSVLRDVTYKSVGRRRLLLMGRKENRMTKEKAISIISGYEAYGCGYCLQGGEEVEEALRLAVDALRQEIVIRCKDCKFATITDGVYGRNPEVKYCDIWFPTEAEYMPIDYYCASAERKEE